MTPQHVLIHHSLTKDGEVVDWEAILGYHRVRSSLPGPQGCDTFEPSAAGDRGGYVGEFTSTSESRVDSHRFGSVAFFLGYVTLQQLQQALGEQIGDNVSGRKHRSLGTILREKNWITAEQGKEILAEMEKLGP